MYMLDIKIEDTSYHSMINGLEEILKKLKEDEDDILWNKPKEYKNEYTDDSENGKYCASLTVEK